MEYLEIPCCKGPGLRIRVKGLIHKSNSEYQEIAIYDTEPYGRCLILDGLIQCAESDHELYDRAILQMLNADDKRLLILGGGDGYTAEMAIKLNTGIEVTVVDLDGAVVSTCKSYLNQNIFDHPKVSLIVDDAFHFMEKVENGGYDGIVCDLTDFPVGYNDGKFRGFYETVFTLSAKILKAGGWISVYAGSKNMVVGNNKRIIDILSKTLGESFEGVECIEAIIPSFGEPCYFLYGKKYIAIR
jgi:spermidine synthase